jgi:hypothetical protein
VNIKEAKIYCDHLSVTDDFFEGYFVNVHPESLASDHDPIWPIRCGAANVG